MQTLIAAIMALIAAVMFFTPWKAGGEEETAYGVTIKMEFFINGMGSGEVKYSTPWGTSTADISYSLGWIGILSFVFTILMFIFLLIKSLMPLIRSPAAEYYATLMDRLILPFFFVSLIIGAIYGGLLIGGVGEVEVAGTKGTLEAGYLGYGFIVFLVFDIITFLFYKRIIKIVR